MENRHEVGVSRKQILILEDENRLLNRLVRLLEELCPGAEIFRTVELEEAYHMAFGKQVELIFIRMQQRMVFIFSVIIRNIKMRRLAVMRLLYLVFVMLILNMK